MCPPYREPCHASRVLTRVSTEAQPSNSGQPGGTDELSADLVADAGSRVQERDPMFVSGAVGIDRALPFYRFSCVQTVADYHRRVFDQSRCVTQLFGPEDVVAAANQADREIPA